ncbi:hypothetical protein PTKIN_Ptkin04bG0155300 [Pterospermum kingtungense]
MGKIGGNSWLTAVKKAFRSPNKENEKKSCRRREDSEQEEEEKKRGKRRWIFKKPSSYQETVIQHGEARTISAPANAKGNINSETSALNSVPEAAEAEQRHAIAVAIATTAAAQAAVATAQAAVEVVRLTRPSIFVREHFAAIVVQTAFRGYLARRALRALKGLVKLQALVRGHNVRKRANITLRCMEAMVRVQARVRDQRKRLSAHEGSGADSALSDSNSLRSSHVVDRKSISREESSNVDDWIHWDENPKTLEDIQAILQKTKEAATLKREKALAYAFSHQIWRTDRDTVESEEELDGKTRWVDRSTTRKQWESIGRMSCDNIDPIKTVEIDTSRPYSYSAPHSQKTNRQIYHYQQQRPSSFFVTSPLHKANNSLPIRSITPSPSKAKPLQMYSASPRCLKEEKSHPPPHTPNTGSYNHRMSGNAAAKPNYMAATASAKARFRSQSAPKQRPSTPEREKVGSAKKRLSFPVPPDPCGVEGNKDQVCDYNSGSPSYRSRHGGHIGMELKSNISSCYADSLGEEIFPPSTNDLRKWLR